MEWYKVKVYYSYFDFEDEIQGVNKEDALKNAHWNWENSERIELI
jgi:hypothetical protein